jgi:hypothetical protein
MYIHLYVYIVVFFNCHNYWILSQSFELRFGHWQINVYLTWNTLKASRNVILFELIIAPFSSWLFNRFDFEGYQFSPDGNYMLLAERRDCKDYCSIFCCEGWTLLKVKMVLIEGKWMDFLKDFDILKSSTIDFLLNESILSWTLKI